MKIKKKFRVEILVIVCTLLISYVGSAFVLNRTLAPEDVRIRNFFMEDKNSLDVVVIGSSAVYTSYSAPLAWHEFGVTSYALASAGAPMGIAKSMIIESENRQKPKAIVVDLNGIMYNDFFENKEGSLRLWIDNMPYSKNKMDTIREVVPKKDQDTYKFPILKYHDNWKEIEQALPMALQEIETRIRKDNLAISGYAGVSSFAKRENIIENIDFSQTTKLHKDSGKHLQELLAYLQKKDTKNVVFMIPPRYYDEKMLDDRKILNTASQMVQKAGFQVYDLDQELHTMKLDPHYDYYNQDHVNIHGQRKVTKYLMERLQKDFQIQGNHSDHVKKKWDKEYQTYEKVYEFIDQKIKSDYHKYWTYKDLRKQGVID
ncbi:MAG: hypothetical protein RR602_08315 [Longicatena sp.]